MKTRELFMGEKQAILKQREDGKSIRAIAQTLVMSSRRKKPLCTELQALNR